MGSYAKGDWTSSNAGNARALPGGGRRVESATSAQGGDAKPNAGAYTLNEVPQPQVVLALGLLNTNPLPFKPSE